MVSRLWHRFVVSRIFPNRVYFSYFRAAVQTATVASGCGILSRGKHTLPDLPYDFGALEPHISGQILEVHHQKHHNTYVTNLNVAEEKLA